MKPGIIKHISLTLIKQPFASLFSLPLIDLMKLAAIHLYYEIIQALNPISSVYIFW